MSANDWSQVVLAVCAVLGFLVVLAGGFLGYGAFKGRAQAMAENQKDATRRVFADIDELRARLDTQERRTERARGALKRAGLDIPENTQVGPDGRGQKVPR